MSTGKHDSNNDSNDKLPSLRRLLSPEYRRRLREGTIRIENIVEESNNQALDDDFISSRGWRASSSYNKRTELLRYCAQNLLLTVSQMNRLY